MTENFKKNRRVIIVAELSANHGNNLDLAIRTIQGAAKAGADAIGPNLQALSHLLLILRMSILDLSNLEWMGKTPHELYAEAALPYEWHSRLKEVCSDCAEFFRARLTLTR